MLRAPCSVLLPVTDTMHGMVEFEVLAAYPAQYQPGRLEYLGWAGGFSGARFWKLECLAGLFCLRCWPADHPTEEQLARIHAVLRWAAQRGCEFLPVPQPTRQGHTYVACGKRLWELTPWMPGEADYHARPSQAKLEGAMKALARFHRAVADFPWPSGPVAPGQLASLGRGPLGFSPGIGQRLEKLRGWSQGRLAELRGRLAEGGWPELAPWADRAIRLATQAIPLVEPLLHECAQMAVRLQPCVGDIWHDHVLFTGQRVTGLVDFGSMRFDSIAGDLARLLGSLVMDDAAGWQIGLAAYEEVAGPLDPAERRLIEAFDRSTVVLAPLNWVDWIYLQRRHFEDRPSIVERMRQWVRRLESSARVGGQHPAVWLARPAAFHGHVQFP